MSPEDWILITIFPVCSFAGLAALLRSHRELTKRAVASAILNSGFFGVAVAALMFQRYGADSSLYLTIGVSILAGLGGNTAVDFGIEMLKTYVAKSDGKDGT